MILHHAVLGLVVVASWQEPGVVASTEVVVRVTALQLLTKGNGTTTSALEAAVRTALQEHPRTQVVTVPSQYLAQGVDVAAPEIGGLAKELQVALMVTGFTGGADQQHQHFAVLFNQDGVVVLNRTSVPTKELDCGVESNPFDVAMVQISSRRGYDSNGAKTNATISGDTNNGGTTITVGIGMLLNREWECFHGPRVLMLRQVDLILVAGAAAPLPGVSSSF